MNLRKMLFWNTSPSVTADDSLPSNCSPKFNGTSVMAESSVEPLNNVIQLPPRSPLDHPAGLEVTQQMSALTATTPNVHKAVGLMNTPELKAFFEENFFGLGRHNGSKYRTQEALSQGKQSMVSRFQNTVTSIVEQLQAKIDRLSNMELQTQGICSTTTAQLDLARTRLERDIAVLRDQINQAQNGKGWVLEALNRYQIGFGKGLREAIDFELLGN